MRGLEGGVREKDSLRGTVGRDQEFCLLFFGGVSQEEVDMMVGLTDDQAGKIAKHLKLQEGGPSYEAVREQQTPSAV